MGFVNKVFVGSMTSTVGRRWSSRTLAEAPNTCPVPAREEDTGTGHGHAQGQGCAASGESLEGTPYSGQMPGTSWNLEKGAASFRGDSSGQGVGWAEVLL